ncbi:MAG: uroporphyrinogen decarboxylase family protein [Clostridia bacterium]|jgi:uroporphyrinogen decarboxylase
MRREVNQMQPDFQLLEDVLLRKGIPCRVPLYEHFVDQEIIEAVMGWDFSKMDRGTREGELKVWEKIIEFYRQMGYDYVPLEMAPRFASRGTLIGEDTALYSRGQRGWVDEHGGPIQSWEDLERKEYWPDVEEAFDYELFQAIADLVPKDMKIIGGASGGPFEHASFLMGLTKLCMAIYDDPDFVACFFEKIGKTLVGVAERLVKLDAVGAYRFGDDLGFKTATMLSPEILRKYVFPWQKKVVEVVHEAGKPFVLHSCGNLEMIMEDLIEDVGIDAKHSYEDVIMPVAEAKKRWGDRIAILGGIDVDYLCRHTPAEIKEYTKKVLDACAPGGGYAAGSGNTIANYVPVESYLAMLEAVREFNGMA